MNDKQTSWAKGRQHFFDEWALMTFYERFEQVVALILANVIAVVVVMSLFQLIRALVVLLASEAFDLLDHAVFQNLFGMIMTLLIAMEFKHSIIRVALRRDSIIQVKTVVLIALIALARKFVILDTAPPRLRRSPPWRWRCWPWAGCTGCYASAMTGGSGERPSAGR